MNNVSSVIGILAVRSFVQLTDKKQEDLLDLITALKKKLGPLSQRFVYSKAALDDSLSTIDTTSRDQNKLYHCTIALRDGAMIALWLEAINKSFLKVKI